MKRILWGSFMLGMGIGVFLTALAAIIWFTQPNVDNALSDQQIMDRAKALGMIDPTKGDYKQNIKIDEHLNKRSPQESLVVLNVVKGMTVSDVANMLRDTGIISDTDAFIDKVRQAGLMPRLQLGVFKIKKGNSEDEIIRLLFGNTGSNP